ncbi:Glucoamylase, intracellular sporulation-specific [Puccinia graminis f. sp. tritici]|uniref:glucan 1,4-alpha-glucosidase n=1 Tax=Puccinia graminis f. sp. tritici TaxID=56615 RepID=A0A5B0PD58_PUCGR|nr:Glucoamylase, intracellular sporulation-specific [Puccinia graminis f. sp. tritici]KAA1125991.1 Glucoamylase, intracellular sporulation-specific [Puccinia graminis f. sp. tritici]
MLSIRTLLAHLLVLDVCFALTAGGSPSTQPTYPYKQQVQHPDLDAWIAKQADLSWSNALTNISPHGALPGLIVASLSTSKPDYYYSWTRDTSIVLKEIVWRYQETQDPKLLALIKQTISATQVIQRSSSGATAGLGEPKYFVNGSAFTGPWGRPQRDGPALRASVYIKFALAYLRVGGPEAAQYVKSVLYDGQWKSRSVIKADLEYISNSWKERSFDLWEEVNGHHFFTFAVIHRALKDGASFATKMEDHGAAAWYQKQADLIAVQLDSFWDTQARYIQASRNFVDSHGKKSGLDVGTLLGCLHAGTQAPQSFRPDSDKMINTFHAILQSMSKTYPLNSRFHDLTAKAVGRYPEDIYDGVSTSVGNPWFITTLTMAEYIYRLNPKTELRTNRWSGSDGETQNLTSRMIGDQFVSIVRNFIQPNGSIHEQFDRVNGAGIGARDLTWSHISFLSMDRARRGLPEF